MLSELKDLVHQNTMLKIGESNVESVLVTTDECITEANMHIMRRNSPTRVNNSVIDDRGAEVDQPSFVNRLKGEQPSHVDHLKEDNRRNGSMVNDSLVSKSTQTVREITAGATKKQTIR